MKSFFTRDDATGVMHDARMRFYVTEKLGPKQAKTPEGFLVIHDVPIARTGPMTYGPGEIPLDAGPDGVITIVRDAVEVFRPEFIASFAGKPVVNDHPDSEVNPGNWRDTAVGTVMHPHRGEGVMSDLLVADLVIHDAAAIADIEAGKREVSCGYDAEYEETSPGHGLQKNMVGNHVALVDSGRCGPRCAIGDRRTVQPHRTGDCSMSKKTFLDRMKEAFVKKDQTAFDAAALEAEAAMARDGEGEALHLHLDGGRTTDAALAERVTNVEGALVTIDGKLDALIAKDKRAKDEGEDDPEFLKKKKETEDTEENLEEEAPAGTGDRARKAKDSAFLTDSFQDTVALSEILVPGIKVLSLDAASAPAKTLDAICKMRRNALDLAYAQPEGRGIIDELLAGKPLTLDKMSCRDVRTLFRSAAAVKKQVNNKQAEVRDADKDKNLPRAVLTPADLNKRNRAHFGQSS